MAFRTNKMPTLQEKSASGAVATFNTALAMPLASCNIAVNAWQEGSGDPSPDNVRPIHGFSELNVTRAGKNLFDEEYPSIGQAIKYMYKYVGVGTFTMSSNIPTSGYNLVFFFAGKVDTGASTDNTVKEGISRTVTTVDGYITIGYRRVLENYPYEYDIQLEAGSTATAYEPYTGNIYTIQLGQEVYGAEVDVVNGVAHCTHNAVDLGDFTYNRTTASGGFYYFYAYFDDRAVLDNDNLCEIFKYMGSSANVLTGDWQFAKSGSNTRFFFRVDTITDTNDFKEAVRGYKIFYPLETPFDIQLTPTQIETLIGNNTIFADTGDVDLTYKDLDIAKRGNFREVFRLPQ